MYEEYPEELLVKVTLKMISEHLTEEFDVSRLVGIHMIFDELSPESKEFVLNNIYIPKNKTQFCSITRMGEFRDALKIRAQL